MLIEVFYIQHLFTRLPVTVAFKNINVVGKHTHVGKLNLSIRAIEGLPYCCLSLGSSAKVLIGTIYSSVTDICTHIKL